MIIEKTPRLAVRTFRMSKPDGTEYWQGRFSLQIRSGAWWHGVTVNPHRTEEDAERDALRMAKAKQTAVGLTS